MQPTDSCNKAYGFISDMTERSCLVDAPQYARKSSWTSLGKAGPSANNSKSLYSVAVGQAVSLLVAGTGACTTLLKAYTGMDAPAAQNFPNYVVMSLFLCARPRLSSMAAASQRSAAPAPVPTRDEDDASETTSHSRGFRTSATAALRGGDGWWKYAVLALVDVEANVLAVWAYQYTSITSAMLLDCVTIPTVMLLSVAMLGAKYTLQHFAGALLCFGGLVVIVLSDSGLLSADDGGDGGAAYPHAWWGDCLCVAASVLYAVSNVVQETWVRSSGGPVRFLGCLGACGAAISATQALLLERVSLFSTTTWSGWGLAAWGGYTACLGAAYATTSWFLVGADAALFNLSLLTSDV